MNDLFSRLAASTAVATSRAAIDDPFATPSPPEHVERHDTADVPDTPAVAAAVPEFRAEPAGDEHPTAVGAAVTDTHRPDIAPANHREPVSREPLHPAAPLESAARQIAHEPRARERDESLNDGPGDRRTAIPIREPAAGTAPDVQTPPTPVVAAVVHRPPVLWEGSEESATSATAHAQPTVRIHIGRLDVRTSPRSRQAKEQETVPEHHSADASLSLDDYLSGSKAAP